MPVEGGCQPRPTRPRRCRPVKQEPAGHASAWRKHWTPRTGALTGQGDDVGHHTFTVRGADGAATSRRGAATGRRTTGRSSVRPPSGGPPAAEPAPPAQAAPPPANPPNPPPPP